jgi:hypothetical protein
VAEAVPNTLRAHSSRARRLSSAATTEVKWRPRGEGSRPPWWKRQKLGVANAARGLGLRGW